MLAPTFPVIPGPLAERNPESIVRHETRRSMDSGFDPSDRPGVTAKSDLKYIT